MELIEITQQFPEQRLEDIEAAVKEEVGVHLQEQQFPAGSRIAITAGSRGIYGIDRMLAYTVETVKQFGCVPFLVPAMGSHGGATAEGQRSVLEHLGITEETSGAEILSSMEVAHVADTANGIPAYMDKNAYQADGIIAINRIKAHTAFRGSVESGLSKMVAIGLGKIKGAAFIHSHGSLQMEGNIKDICRTCLEKAPPIMGIGIVENAFDQTAIIEAVRKEQWFEEEAELLKLSKQLMPSLPVKELDVLIVEEMGKNYSGTGMDPNIIGRWRIDGVPEPVSPVIRRIAALELSKESFGNAQGVGLVDFITQALFDTIDRHTTYTNALTSTYLRRAMIPFIYETEQKAVETALNSLSAEDTDTLKYIQVPNTLHLHRLYVSPAVLQEMESQRLSFDTGEHFTLSFTDEGRLSRRLLRP
ncbi:lactate racemase domain-containing protein [Sinobaca sp. H24]|uniref:lactate racemase domain-containing protein n=1 Tax=Sinobaca sp. H24 TaxID=2923376 RepID=UPI00207A39DA|nr:lactate racemase domain-containing protein [Sinobaca sp. H24]